MQLYIGLFVIFRVELCLSRRECFELLFARSYSYLTEQLRPFMKIHRATLDTQESKYVLDKKERLPPAALSRKVPKIQNDFCHRHNATQEVQRIVVIHAEGILHKAICKTWAQRRCDLGNRFEALVCFLEGLVVVRGDLLPDV